MGSVKNDKFALSLDSIKSFYEKNIQSKSNIPFHFSFLQDINKKELPALTFIHTGEKQDEVNSGYSDHWLLLVYDKLFDSYGYQKFYDFGESNSLINPVILHPRRIQEFGSVVCGEYCLNFCDYFFSEKDESEHVGANYCKIKGYSTNTKENDEEVLQWFRENNANTGFANN